MKILLYKANEFYKLKPIWEDLQKGSDMTVFQTYNWYKLLNDQYLNSFLFNRMICRYEYYVLYDGNIPKLIFPIMIQTYSIWFKGFGIKRGIYFIGNKGYLN